MIKIIVCFNCKNYIKDFKCAAFPNGIPEEILRGENPHTEPLPNQENNIIFEPINEQEQ